MPLQGRGNSNVVDRELATGDHIDLGEGLTHGTPNIPSLLFGFFQRRREGARDDISGRITMLASNSARASKGFPIVHLVLLTGGRVGRA